MERKLDLLRRMYLLVFLFLVVAVILFYRVINISIVEGEHWRAQRDSLYLKYVPIEAVRGNILSDDGSFLATSLQLFDIRVDLNSTGMRPEDFNKNIDSLAICLSRYVDQKKSSTMYKNYLIKKRKEGSRSVLIKRGATYRDLELIKSFPLFRMSQNRGGLTVFPQVIRKKPFKSLAHRTIGAFRENAQLVGLEGYFDDYLKGEEGKQLRYRVSANQWLPVNELNEITPLKGLDIKTTLNVGLQDVAHTALMTAVEYHDADYGVAVVMEVKTGAIKAISNLKKTEGGGYAELYNHAVGTKLEPGSTIKLATMMALLEDDKIDLDDRLKVGRGQGSFCGRIVKDSEVHSFEETTTRHAFEISSNVGMARLVTEKYKSMDEEHKFISKLRQFHLDKKTGIEIKGEPAPYIKNAYDRKENWSCTSSPWMSFGYELAMTPLQILAFYNAVANDGRYMKPYLVSEILEDRVAVQSFYPTVKDENIAKESTIKQAKKLLEGVMLNGTGKDIKLPFSCAGKTGTSQINYSDKSAKKTKYMSSFVGYFPADDPQYSCIVMINDPLKNGYYGSKVAGPVFREIALKCMNRIPEQHQNEVAGDHYYPLFNAGYKKDVKTILDNMELAYEEWTDADYVVLIPMSDSIKLDTRIVSTEKVPNVMHMALRDALFVLENQGYRAKLLGRGRVIKQEPKAGDLRLNKEIELTLK